MNPLLKPSPLKNSAVPFDKILPSHFPEAIQEAIKTGQRILENVRQAPASFDHTIRGLEECVEELEFTYGLFHNLLSAHANDELQKLSEELGPVVASFSNDILLDPQIYARVQQVYKARFDSALDAEQIRLVEKVHLDFERSGASLTDAQKIRVREIDARLAVLHPKFRENALRATSAFELWLENESDLAGLPAGARTAAKEAAVAKGRPEHWLIELQMPSYLPFISFSDRRDLREKLARAFLSRCFHDKFDNQNVILEMIALQQEKAKLLGQPSYAHHALQVRMAETPERVMDFLNRLLKVAKPAAERELGELQKLAQEMNGPTPLQPWDFTYYAEKLKEKKYAFNEEDLRPYFKLENVLEGVFEHARKLFQLKFIESDEYPRYHEDVRVFEVYKENAEKTFVGLFYADFFPRPSKNQGAWMTDFYIQGHFRKKKMRPHVSIVCNFTKPTKEEPSLLTFDEVLTLFHEFGHALHGLLSNVNYRSLGGTNVYLDFVELPSQILENWAYEEESLRLFAFHHKTGEPLPMELVQKLKRAQKFLAGNYKLRQLEFAYLDMGWFLTPPQKGESVDAFEKRITAASRLLTPIPGTNKSCTFGHIFGGGYASGYYSYKWAEALDADAFELFKEKGIFDQETAARFEEFILSKGGSDHPMRLFEKFRGRGPDPDALLRRDGLL